MKIKHYFMSYVSILSKFLTFKIINYEKIITLFIGNAFGSCFSF
jgi:hypothetical protein